MAQAFFTVFNVADSVYIQIVHFLLQRKHCFLETADWKTIPWLIKHKSLGSTLQDLFCDVPGLMEDADMITSRSTPGEDLEGMKEALYEKVENTMQQAYILRWRWEQDHANACKEVPIKDYSLNPSADQDVRLSQKSFTSVKWIVLLRLCSSIHFICF